MIRRLPIRSRRRLTSIAVGTVTALMVGLGQMVGAQAAGATVTVDTSRSSGSLPADALGFSYEADRLHTSPGFDPTQGNIAALYQNLGPQHLRIGAGAVDAVVFWDPNGAPLPSYATTPITPADLQRLAALSAATGYQVQLGVDLRHLSSYSVSSEAQSAVSAFAAHPGSHLANMECGNEPNLFTGYGYATFIGDFNSCSGQIASAGVPVAGPNTNHDAFEPAFVNAEHSKIVLMTDQLYTLGGGPGSSATLTQLLSPASVSSELSNAAPIVSQAHAVGLPVRRDETNSANGGGVNGLSNVYGAALWAVDYVLLVAQAGVSGFNFHGTIGPCGHVEWDNRVRFYTPLCAASTADYQAGILTPQPVYYGMLMAHLMGSGSFLPTTVSASNNLTAYSVRGTDGLTRVMLVEKDPTGGSVSTTVNVSGAGDGSADVLHLTGTSLTSASGIAIQGASVDRAGHFTAGTPDQATMTGGSLSLTIPTGSATLITLHPGGAPCTSVPSSPTNVVGAANGGGQMTVTWNPSTSCAPVIAYAVYRYGSDGSAAMGESLTNSFVETGLTPNVYYTFTVTGFNHNGWSGWSNWASWVLAT